jgi:hypothetical protein
VAIVLLALALALAVAPGPASAAPGRAAPSFAPAPRAAAPAPAVPPNAVAFLGLRPTEDATFGATAIARLADAQRLRAVAENVVGLLSGAPVLGHEDLRRLVGPAYLVSLFECEGDAVCQLAVAAPLRARGIRSAVAADVATEPDAHRLRVRRLDLARGAVVDEVTFPLPRDAAETLPPWRDGLRRLFEDTGALRVVSNVKDATCTLDGKPCEADADGVVSRVAQGEHVIELSKEGYRRAVRAVTVARGEEQRVALALDELPIQAQRAPDPANRVPIFEPPGETTRVAPFGLVRVSMGWDSANAGDREDLLAPPRGVPDASATAEGHFLVLPRPSVLGVSVQAPRRESGWQLRGAFSIAWVKESTPEIDSAYGELVQQDLGFRVLLGFGPGIVSGLTAGTLTIPEGFGDLNAGFIGATLSKSFGDVLFEGFVGRHKSQFTAVPIPGGAAPGPFAGARIAFSEEELEGRLYGEKYPLTISVSGLVGQERVGLDAEAEFVGTAVARQESPVWVGSLEVFLPWGTRASLAGEAYVGQNAHLLEGAAWQGPRVDLASGRHTALRSVGGWAQLAVNLGELELRLLGGLDRTWSGLAAGAAPAGVPAARPVRENRLVAVNGVYRLLDHLAVGVQLHALATRYADPQIGAATLLGAVFTSQIKF